MKSCKYAAALGIVGLVWFPLAPAALAQEEEGAAVVDAEESAAVLGVVVVTAQRREQSLEDVPLTMTVLTGQALSDLGIDTPAEVAAQTPGFEVYSIFGEGTNPTFFMRGIGQLDFGDVTETPVALNLDDVYLGTQAAQSAPLFDVERVEVLKGPQGTLYGRNATGGVVNVISARPTAKFEGRASAQAGSFGQEIFEVALSGPLAPRVRGRLSLRSNRDDGWQRSLTTGVDNFGQTDLASGRAQLEFDTSENATLLLRADYAKSDGNSVLYPLTGLLRADGATYCTPAEAAANLCFNSAGEQGIRDPRVGLSDVPSLRNEFEFRLGSATYTHDFGGVTLTSITAAQSVDKLFEEDADAAAIDLGFTEYRLSAEQFTQEVRLAGGDEEGLGWLAGAYFFDEDRSTSVAAPPFFSTLGEQESSSWAVFGSVDYPLTSTVTATGGLRYTTDKKNISVVTPGFMPEQQRSLDESRVTGKLGLSWEPTDDLLWYANVSTGYKAGGFNANFVFDPDTIGPVEPESITAYELGLRAKFWDGRISFNGATFAYDYRDIQAVALDSTSVVSITRLISLGDANIFGFDGEVNFIPVDAARISLGIGLLDTEIQSSATQSTPFPPGAVALDGNPLPMAPSVSLNGLAEYTFAFGDAGFLTAQLDGSWRDDFNFSATGSKEATESSDGFALLNARLRWRSANERYALEGFVENLVDEDYFTFNANIFSDNAAGAWGRPRTWGVRLQSSF